MKTDAEQIEADRRKRERELLLLLLLFLGRARRYAVHAIKLGIDPLQAMRATWLGNSHFQGIVKPLSKVMADAHQAGYVRAARMIGVDATPPAATDLATYYAPKAQQAAEQMLATMQRVVTRGLAEMVKPGDLRETMDSAGYGADNPTALERAAEPQILQPYQDGFGAAVRPAVDSGRVKGFRYVATLDMGTTPICRAYHDTKLAADHPWWRNHAPQNHFGCRSFYLPILTDFESTAVPAIQPAPGFGFDALGPLAVFEETRTAA